MDAPESDLTSLRRRLLHRFRWVSGKADLDDAIQEALIALWQARERAMHVASPFPFLCTVVERKLLRQARDTKRLILGNVDEALVPKSTADNTDWSLLLDALGFQPTIAWTALLRAIANGTRTHKGLARALARNVTSIKESRARLQKWLHLVLRNREHG